MKAVYIILFVLLSVFSYGQDNIVVGSGSVQVTATFKTPPKANTPFSMNFSFSENGKSIEVTGLQVSYTMNNMNMGKFIHNPVLTEGVYPIDKLTLPRCMSGNKTWNAELTFEYGGEKHKTVLSFELQ